MGVPVLETLSQGVCLFIRDALGSFYELSMKLGAHNTDVHEIESVLFVLGSLSLADYIVIRHVMCTVGCRRKLLLGSDG